MFRQLLSANITRINLTSTPPPEATMATPAIYQQYTETTFFVLPLYIITIIVGTVGNGLVFRSYLVDKSAHSCIFRFLIANLSVADLILCALFTPILLVYRSNASAMLIAKTPLCEGCIFLSMLSISMMYAIFPLLALHRKDVMLNPREPKMTMKQVQKIVAVFWSFCCVTSLGLVGMAWRNFLNENNTNPKFYRCLLINTEVDAFTVYFLGYSSLLYGLSIAITVSIYWTINKHMNSNLSGVNASADERHVTKMCFWIAIVYTVCWTPFLVVQLSGIFGQYSEVYFNLHACSSGVGVIGSAINPIVYAVMDPYYRATLLPFVKTANKNNKQ
ncbi:neuromedin-U receptor 2 [Exaiptasia diaphana]|uniref:G-protein coupled receptors family 1 profile domain-containing protein n=1 Tax=Exaiptasia diaphana TaxID=2652724 RepID=A0A913Y7S5_EXADI|nr:neuromedin-U receptor 2 [Exaiptasia diaphana]XP_020915526.1 neuromedin-U receptor 2 [Exaiptasia diaphana]